MTRFEVGTVPKVAILSATPLRGDWATSHLMSDLFADWPNDRLCQVTIERHGLHLEEQPIATLALPALRAKKPSTLTTAYRQLQRFLNDQSVDVVYFRTAGWPVGLEVFAMFLARRRATVTHVMDDWPALMRADRRWLARFAEPVLRSALRSSVGHLAISAPMAVALEERYGVDFAVAHCGVDRPASPAALSLSARQPTEVFYSGTIATEQTAQSLVDIAASTERVRRGGTGVVLTVVPATPIGEELRRQLEGHGATIGVRGTHDEYITRLQDAAVVVATSNFDERTRAFLRYSMPNKTADLLASGTPILAYGPHELAWVAAARAGGWATVVAERDPQALDAALIRLLTNDAARSELVLAAQSIARSSFSLATMQQRVADSLLLAARGK